MNTEDKTLMSTMLIVMGILVIITVVVFMLANLLSTASENTVKNTDAYQQQHTAQVEERLMKVGSVETFDPSAKPVVRSGKEIYDTACTTCHQTGVLDAPKLGTASDWQPRLAGGFDALVTSGITGKGAMPPKGGDASLTDMEMKKVVAYMLKESGLDAPNLSAESENSAASEAPATAPTTAPVTASAPAVSTAPAITETVTNAASSATTAVTATAVAATAAVTGAASSAMKAITGHTPKAAVAPVATPAPVAAPVAAAPKVATASGNLDKGKSIYKTACFACHDSGVAGAPKLGDKAAWVSRIAAGMDSMVQVALTGKGGMPPKGGRLDLSTEDIQAAVAFMAAEAQQSTTKKLFEPKKRAGNGALFRSGLTQRFLN
ncbi:MAG TPA: hypothetical protein DD827_04340 [Gammaproteobacteria bacterium]|nr:hypothetical protein [Gammaproteobacteria bacterium]